MQHNRLPQHSNFAKEFGPDRCVNTVTGPNQSDRTRIIMTDAPFSGNAPAIQEIISRDKAVELGLKTYFTGLPCKHGHVAEKRVRCRTCVECSKAISKAWYANNKEASLAHRHQYQIDNRTKISAMKKAWRHNNSERYKAYRSALRARRNGAEGFYTADDIARIITLQKGKCAFCKTSISKKSQADHITPLARGGTNWPNNIQMLCATCNQRKHAMDPIKFAQKMSFLV